MGWLRNQWEDVRGDAKWDAVKWVVGGVCLALAGSVVWLRPWLLSLSLAVKILSLLVIVLLISNCVLACLWLRERRRPSIRFSGPPPGCLFPLEESVTVGKPQDSRVAPSLRLAEAAQTADRSASVGRSQTICPRPSRPRPEIQCRGFVRMDCRIPYFDLVKEAFEDLSPPCIAMAFRNTALTSNSEAHDVVAHLDFVSANHGCVTVNEGWWFEDADETGLRTFYIGRAETKHLVLVIGGESGACAALPKIWSRNSGRHMPGEPIELARDIWKLTVELTGEGFREVYHCEGVVTGISESKWSMLSAAES